MLTNPSHNYSTLQHFSKTAKTPFYRSNRSTLEPYLSKQRFNQTMDRPHTSLLLTHQFNSTLRSKAIRFVDEREIQSAEHDLQTTHQLDLSNYLHKKFRNFIIKKRDNHTPDRPSFDTLENPEMINSYCSKMKISMELDSSDLPLESSIVPSNSKVVKSAYIVNAKEHISRLIQMKREREENFSRLSEGIKSRCMLRQRSLKKNSLRMAIKETIEDKEWDKKWRNQYLNQVKRYKTRLLSKSKGKSAQNQPQKQLA